MLASLVFVGKRESNGKPLLFVSIRSTSPLTADECIASTRSYHPPSPPVSLLSLSTRIHQTSLRLRGIVANPLLSFRYFGSALSISNLFPFSSLRIALFAIPLFSATSALPPVFANRISQRNNKMTQRTVKSGFISKAVKALVSISPRASEDYMLLFLTVHGMALRPLV